MSPPISSRSLWSDWDQGLPHSVLSGPRKNTSNPTRHEATASDVLVEAGAPSMPLFGLPIALELSQPRPGQ